MARGKRTASQSKSELSQQKPYLTIGAILRPHGMRGELVVKTNSELLQSLRPGSEVQLGERGPRVKIISIRPHRNHMLVGLKNVTNRAEAEELRGRTLVLDLEDIPELPDGVYFRWQILDLAVVDEKGENLGKIVDILETGANDVYIIGSEDQADILIPAIETVIIDVRLDDGEMVVRIPDGLLIE